MLKFTWLYILFSVLWGFKIWSLEDQQVTSLVWTDLAGAHSCFPPCLLAFVPAASFGEGKVDSELAPVSHEEANTWRK